MILMPITPEDNPYKLVEFEPHLSGTPDSPPPLTPGFKDPSYNCPIETENYLSDLSREHIFIVINEFGIGTPDINKTYKETIKERLLLVSKRDNLAQGKNEVGMISLDKLQEYILNYDVHTGKRKAITNESPRKRRTGPTRESSEEL
ncbi:hypothetical protein N7530_010748 [Penicillium desertorum]|uniref:Uncharacterized protein n=1 Tax=Penicillium desertorum TaxID=1303715 RepID=A0A9W9WG48_9EURO|nr:hypothetical protein N7530_010748 [Penicillium desertorum]